MCNPKGVDPLDKIIKDYCLNALYNNNGDVVGTAKKLNIGKTTFYRWLILWKCNSKVLVQSLALRNIGLKKEPTNHVPVRK